MRVRPARPDDAPVIAAVHVRAWQHAYRGGLMPDDYLDALSVDERAGMWQRALSRQTDPPSALLVAQDATGAVAGFIAVGAEAGEPVPRRGEVYALNVDPDRWGQGVGRALLEAGCEHLRRSALSEAVLWVHPDNPRACGFYEAAGWTADGAHRREEVLGVEVPEIRYRRTLVV